MFGSSLSSLWSSIFHFIPRTPRGPGLGNAGFFFDYCFLVTARTRYGFVGSVGLASADCAGCFDSSSLIDTELMQ